MTKTMFFCFFLSARCFAIENAICTRFLENETPGMIAFHQTHKDHRAFVTSSPVRKQCLGSCSVHSHIGLLENISGRILDVDYNVLLTTVERGKLYLSNMDKIPFTTSKFVNLVAQSAASTVASTASQGVLFPGQFSLSDESLKLLEESRSMVNSEVPRRVTNTTNPVETVGFVLGALFKKLQDGENVSRVIGRLVSQLETDINKVRFDAVSNSTKIFNKKPTFTVIKPMPVSDPRSNSGRFPSIQKKSNYSSNLAQVDLTILVANKKAMLDAIIESLEKGYSVQLNFGRLKRLLEVETGAINLDMPLGKALKLRLSRSSENFDENQVGHGNLIENYRKLPNRKLEFLIKDSHGDDVYDSGYIHMTEDYFWASVYAIVIFSK